MASRCTARRHLAAEFPAFSPYRYPEARRGGRLTLGIEGTFDTLNPFNIKGVPALGLRELVYESLMVRNPDEPFSALWIDRRKHRRAARSQQRHVPPCGRKRGSPMGGR